MLEIRNIAFSYRQKTVLRDVSFMVSPGEIVSVVGANGAGKTTLLKVLATLGVPDSGMVLVDGQDALSHPLKYRRQIGYLPEQPALYDEMTVKEYLEYRAALKGEPGKRVRRRVNDAAEMCQVAGALKTPIRCCRPASASAWRWPTRCCCGRVCCCWTIFWPGLTGICERRPVKCWQTRRRFRA